MFGNVQSRIGRENWLSSIKFLAANFFASFLLCPRASPGERKSWYCTTRAISAMVSSVFSGVPRHPPPSPEGLSPRHACNRQRWAGRGGEGDLGGRWWKGFKMVERMEGGKKRREKDYFPAFLIKYCIEQFTYSFLISLFPLIRTPPLSFPIQICR